MLPEGVVLLVLMLFNVFFFLLLYFFSLLQPEAVQDQFVEVLKCCLCYVPSNQ